MKQSTLLLLFITVSLFATAQSDLPKVVEDTLFTTSGYNIITKQDIKLGMGSLPNGDFKYVTTSSTALFGSGNGPEGAKRKMGGHLFKVKRFRTEGSKKRGYTYYLVLGAGDIVNYECDIESAITAGEIIIPDEFKTKPKDIVVQVKQEVSIADELTKLKKLLDDGVLTKDEYDAQKKKLLEKN